MKLTLGFSPCPNDTFIFDALVNQKIPTEGLTFEYLLEDVETLNTWAFDEKLDITKLSFNTFLHTVDKYALLHSGSALGKGVGPLVVSMQQIDNREAIDNFLQHATIAIPGLQTTANLLMTLAFPNAKNKTEVLFSKIEQSVIDRRFEAGLIIHESRFTYQQKGLHKLIDLGDWWENEMKAAIPLGGIVMKRSFDKELIAIVDRLIWQSVEYSWEHYPQLSEFVKKHALEMEESVMRQHIDLYVNEYTTNLGNIGESSINILFEKAREANLLDKAKKDFSIFYH